MTRQEFMTTLRNRLSLLSPEEREDAVQFYEEYFDEAGPENEQAILSELGSPEALAQKILSGEGKVVPKGQRARRFTADDKKQSEPPHSSFWESAEGFFSSAYRHASNTCHRASEAYQSRSQRRSERQSERRPEPRQSYRDVPLPPRKRVWPWVLLILTSPVWFTVLAGVLACVFGVVVTVVCLLIAAALAVLAFAFLFLFCFGLSFYMMPRDTLNALYILSIGLMSLGGTMILTPIAVLCIRKGFPLLGRGLASCCRWIGGLFHQKGNRERSAER